MVNLGLPKLCTHPRVACERIGNGSVAITLDLTPLSGLGLRQPHESKRDGCAQ